MYRVLVCSAWFLDIRIYQLFGIDNVLVVLWLVFEVIIVSHC